MATVKKKTAANSRAKATKPAWRGGKRPAHAPEWVKGPITGVTFPDATYCQCRISRKGQKWQRTFSYKQHGGSRKAVKAARDWRAEMEARLGPVVLRKSVLQQTDTASGRANVQWIERPRRDGGVVQYCYQARWWDKEHGAQTKSFWCGTDNTYTDAAEQAAFKKAVAWVRKREREWEKRNGVKLG